MAQLKGGTYVAGDIFVEGYVYGAATSLSFGSAEIGTNKWAGTAGYNGYSYTGGNNRFGFSSTGGYIDVYTDGNFYAGVDINGSNNLVLHAGNYNTYAPSLSGSGATGTWGINITGNAATLENHSASYFQTALVSGTSIKTINSTSLLGSGNITVQATLVSGTNIKTINSQSILGSGDIAIAGGATISDTAPTGTSEGMLWFNPYTGKMYTYYGGTWAQFVRDGQDAVIPSTLSLNNLNVSGTSTLNTLNVTGNTTISNVTVGSLSITGLTSLQQVLEKAVLNVTALSGATNFDVSNQGVIYFTSNTTGNWTLNIRGNSGTTLNSIMAVGQSLTIAVLATQGATPYYCTAITIDGGAITPKWQGGSAPTGGNASSIDIYSYTIIKTAASTYTVFASQTKFA